MRFLVAAFLAALPCGVGHAADPVTVGPETRTALGLTVYSGQDLALVRDVRHVTLADGPQELRFDDVPARIDARTVALRSLASGDTLAIREQGFLWDLASTDSLLSRWVGREIELVETGERLRTRTIAATLLRVEGGLVVRIGDRIVPDPPGRVRLPPLGTEVFVRPTLRWRLEASAGARDVEALYATSGLTWAADYLATLDADESGCDLTAWVTVTNESGTRFQDTTLALVSGQVHRQAKEPVARAARAMAMAEAAPMSAAGGAFAESGFSEYHRYALEGRVTLPEHASTQLPLLRAHVGVEKRYQVVGAPHWYRVAVASGDEGERVPVQVVFVVKNTEANHLGRPLPAGVVRFWARDANGTPALVGEDRLAHLPKDETADLTVGDASDLIAFRKQTDFRKLDTDPWQYEAAFQLTLRNRKSTAVTVRVREPIDGQWRVVESSVPSQKIDARTIGFDVPVAAGGQAVLTWRVQAGR